MAHKVRKIPPALKSALIAEAGEKCANPGCSNWRVHIHHIKHWSVYNTHDDNHMIAVCPTCHDAIHHGNIAITDDTIYQWKNIKRPLPIKTAHIYVEPSRKISFIAGGITIKTESLDASLFDLINKNKVSFTIIDGDIMSLSVILKDVNNREAIRIVNSHVKVCHDKSLVFESYPGRVVIKCPPTQNYIPKWLLREMLDRELDYTQDGLITLLDFEVIAPGTVKTVGLWYSPAGTVVITRSCIYAFHPTLHTPSMFRGTGTINLGKQSVTPKVFGFA